MQVRETDLNKIVAALAQGLSKPLPEDFIKAWVQSGSATSGITAYDLEAGAKLLFPVLTPLRNDIPRVGGGVGTATNWRAVTGINSGLLEIGVSEGNRSGAISHTTQDYTAAFKGIGLEDYVTFESDYAGRTFDDVKALAVAALLESTMIGEEQVLLGGNTSLALGTTPTPTLTTATTGGTIANAAAFSVICVALSHAAAYSGSVAGGIRASVARTNTDGSSDTYGGGSAQKSVNATIATTGSGTSTVSATVAAVNGAVAYAWFWGATAGSEVLGAITYINSVLISAAATGTQTAASLPASDQSKNTLVFDGLLTQIFTVGSNAYIARQATGTAGTGTPLTSTSDGGITEFDVALKAFWDTYRLSPSEIWVSSQEQNNITKKIMAAPSTAAQRFVFDVQQGKIMGGSMTVSYLNRFGMAGGGAYGNANELPIRLHPNLTPGTIMFRTRQLPYKLSNVTNVLQVKTRREYYQLEWPLRSRKYEYGVYADEVLQNYFPPAFGVITNIGNG
jgi:hypothetical protein